MRYYIIYLFLIVISTFEMKAEVNPNFHIYLCFGQSNMEGNTPPESVDRKDIDKRFLTLATTNFESTGRTMGKWYKAAPPIASKKIVLSLTDYFGRSMVAALPTDYSVGVVVVAIGGADIRAFMPENVTEYINDTLTYGKVPYQRLVEMAKIAQKSGVIKGILLHQGERNANDPDRFKWLEYVKTIYDHLISDLELNANEVPLLVGEVVNASEEGACAKHNEVIAQIPTVIPTAHVISSIGCPCSSDHLHFAKAGYRIMGKRYAIKMLELLSYPPHVDANYQLPEGLRNFYEAISLNTPQDIDLQPDSLYEIPVTAYYKDEHQENVTAEAVVTSVGSSVDVNGSLLKGVTTERSLITISYTDFTGKKLSTSFKVNPSGLPNSIVNEMVNYIMGNPAKIFNKNTADRDGDGKVNVTDVVHIINE